MDLFGSSIDHIKLFQQMMGKG